MSTLKVHNWDKWQSYRADRGQPPWIKLHRELMRHSEWVSLSDAQRGHLICIWLLAADKNGVIPNCATTIKKLCYLDDEPDLMLLIDKGFLDANVTPRRRQRDAKVTPTRQPRNAKVTHQSREEESRVEKRRVDQDLPAVSLEDREEKRREDHVKKQPPVINLGLVAVLEKKPPRATRIPDFETIPEIWVSEAKKINPTWTDQKASNVFDWFRDYWKSKAGAGATKLDWLATWRNWCRKEPSMSGSGPPAKFLSAGERESQAGRAAIANWLARDEDLSAINGEVMREEQRKN